MDAWTIILLICTAWLWIPLGTFLSVTAVGCVVALAIGISMLPVLAIIWIAERLRR